MPVEEALEELKRCAGTQFDPNLVEIFNTATQNAAATPVMITGDEVASPETDSSDK